MLNGTDKSTIHRNLNIVRHELIKLQEDANKPPFEYLTSLTANELNQEVVESLKDYLVYINLYYLNMGKEASKNRTAVYEHLIEEHGREWVRDLKKNNHNQRLASILQNTNEVKKMHVTDTEIIQKMDPIFMAPLSQVGRAHFYAPYKNIRGYHIDTFIFNLIIIWIGATILYYTLVFDILRKFLRVTDYLLLKIKTFYQHSK